MVEKVTLPRPLQRFTSAKEQINFPTMHRDLERMFPNLGCGLQVLTSQQVAHSLGAPLLWGISSSWH
jgi:hypothetical protein